jgi:hypothetical protein
VNRVDEAICELSGFSGREIIALWSTTLVVESKVMVTYLKTPAAAQAIPTTYLRLINLIRYGKIPAPPKDSSGDYIWSSEDLERARQALKAGRQGKATEALTNA